MAFYGAFQWNAFQWNAFQIARSGGTPPTPSVDTHDGWIPEEAIRKFYENERLKHSAVIKSYKKIIQAEEESEELKEVISAYAPDTSKITKKILEDIAQDKIVLGRFLSAIDTIENRLENYRLDMEDEKLLFMIASII